MTIEQQIAELAKLVQQTMTNNFKKMNDRLDQVDARNEMHFQKLKSATVNISCQLYESRDATKALHEDVTIVKLDVKDAYTRLDGFAETVDRHDSAIITLKR